MSCLDSTASLLTAGRHVGVLGAGRVGVDVFAHQRGAVAGGVQGRADRGVLQTILQEDPVAAVRLGVGVDVMVVGVFAGEDRRARWAAEREGDEVVAEGDPLARDQAPHVGHVGQGIELQVLIIGEQEDDVRPGVDSGRSVAVGETGGQEENAERDQEEALHTNSQ